MHVGYLSSLMITGEMVKLVKPEEPQIEMVRYLQLDRIDVLSLCILINIKVLQSQQ